MHFIVFAGRNAQGQRYADPTRPGILIVNLGPKEFQWRLPLGCLLPSEYDAKTGEEFPGNYVYSPFTGAKLATAKPGSATKGDGK